MVPGEKHCWDRPDHVIYGRIAGGIWNLGLKNLLSAQSLMRCCGAWKVGMLREMEVMEVSAVEFQSQGPKILSGSFVWGSRTCDSGYLGMKNQLG